MKRQYKLEKTELNSSWDEFIEVSQNGTVFSMSEYLKSIVQKHAVYYCCKNQEIRAAVAVIESDDGKSAVLHDFVIYNGLMYAPPLCDQNRAQIHSERLEISE